jgi:hypothetical protein
MAAKVLKLEELEEGEYEVPYGRVTIRRADGGYKIVIYIDERALGRNAAKQILQSFLAPVNGGKPI